MSIHIQTLIHLNSRTVTDTSGFPSSEVESNEVESNEVESSGFSSNEVESSEVKSSDKKPKPIHDELKRDTENDGSEIYPGIIYTDVTHLEEKQRSEKKN